MGIGVVEKAIEELIRNNWEAEDIDAMTEILTKFFSQWDSGGAVWAVAPVLQKLIAGVPLSPLTGEDDEWIVLNLHEDFSHDDFYAQNKRYYSVFKRRDGTAHDINNSIKNITFPYDQFVEKVPYPEAIFELEDDGA